jgi:hypothetical protein
MKKNHFILLLLRHYKKDHKGMFLTVVSLWYPNGGITLLQCLGVAAIFCLVYSIAIFLLSLRMVIKAAILFMLKDVVQANLLALEREEACYEVFNVGIGKTTTALQLAEMLNEHLGFPEPLIVKNKYREGGICHCFADITKIQTKLGYKPKIFRRRNRGFDCLSHKL